MNDIITIKGVRGYLDAKGTAQLNLEDIARGLGITKTDRKDGTEYVRVNRQALQKWLCAFGIVDSESNLLPEYVSESVFYRLAMKRILACVALFIKKVNPNLGRGRASASGKGYDRRMFTPGMVNELEAGDEVDMINPQGQATDAAQYVKLLNRLVAAGQGLSYEAVARDMSGSTYSSTRQNLIEDGMTYADEVELLTEVIDEIYESFLISAVLAGKISAPDFWDRKDVYFAHEWVNPPKPWIDPAKEATATQTALRTGQKTFKQIAAENGKDWRDQIDDIAEVLEYSQEVHGLDLSSMIFGQQGGESAPVTGGGDSDGKVDDEDGGDGKGE